MTFDLEEFDNIVSLAVRRVQTPEGAKKFGQPIGTIITADMLKQANAKPGSAKKSTESESNGKDTSKGVKSATQPKTLGAALDPSTGKMKKGLKDESEVADKTYNGPTLKESTLSGPNQFKVGEATFNVPSGSKLVRPKNQKNVAYVVTPDGSVHAFSESGEVEIPDYLQEPLATKFSNLGKDDALYDIEEFDKSQVTSLKDQKPGAVLNVGEESAFTKIDENTWEHSTLGVTLTDDDLQPQFEAGKFTLQASEATPETDFSKLTADEITAILESYDLGKEVSFNPGAAKTTLRKQENGNWVNPEVEANDGMTSEALSSMVVGTEWLSEKTRVSEDAPQALQDPLKQEGTGKTLADKAKENIPTPEEVDNADILFHDKVGILKRQEDDSWETEDGVSFHTDIVVSSAELGYTSKTPWNADQVKAQQKYNKENSNGESNGSGKSGVSEVSGTDGGDTGSGGPNGGENTDDEGAEPLETHAGFQIPQETLNKIVDLLDSSKKVSAVKEALTDLKPEIAKVTEGGGIAEAKAIVDSIETEHAFHVDGKRVRTFKKFGENDRSASIQASGGSTPPVYHLEKSTENAKLFRDQMMKSLEGNKYSASVYVYDEADYAEMDLFLADDGLSGIALHNGNEIVSVFSTPESKNKKVARHLISVAVQNGGTRLDAFDTVLPDIYAAEGFVTKTRLKWNDDYAPEGWDKETFAKFNNGEPDVVFMEYNESALDGYYSLDDGEYVDTYDKGLASTGGEVTTPETEVDDVEEPKLPENFAQVNSLAGTKPGDKIYIKSDQDVSVGTLTEEGLWEVKGVGPQVYYFEPEDMEYDIEEGNVFADSALPNEEVDDLVSSLDPEFSTPSDEDYAASGLLDEDKQSAIEALESHTGFQVKYGLKSLPEGHPLKNDSILQSELEDAKKAYPNLKPKPALIAYLKGEGPLTPLEDWEKELLNDGETVQIGSETPKKVVQGVTGGSFTQKEIKEAVNILEGYAGKQFKNALVQKGNAVGALSPNDIIGFEKDKLVGKQKYIDFLKGKLEKSKNNQAPKTIDEAIADDDLGLLDVEEELNFDFKNATIEDIDALPEGFEAHANGNTYTKVEADKWEVVLDGTPYIFKSKDMKETFNKDNGWTTDAPEASTEEPLQSAVPKDYSHGDKIESFEDFQNLEIGSQVDDSAESIYTKIGENAWTVPNIEQFAGVSEGEETLDDDAFYGAIETGKIKFYISENDSNKNLKDGDIEVVEDSPLSEGDKITSFEDFGKLKEGSRVYFEDNSGDKSYYTKNDHGSWNIDNSNGAELDEGAFLASVETGNLYFAGTSKGEGLPPVGGSFETLAQLKSTPVGHQIQTNFNTLIWTVKSDGHFGSEFGNSVLPHFFTPTITNDGITYLGLPKTEEAEEVESANGIKPGKYNSGKGAKTSLFVNPDGTGVYKGMKGVVKSLSAEKVQSHYDAGMNNFVSDVEPGDMPDAVTPKTASTKPLGGLNELSDGTYYYGVPGEAKTVAYTVDGDDIHVAKPLTEWDGLKLSQKINKDFLDTAPEGAQVISNYFNLTLTKTDGKWNSQYGDDYTGHFYLNNSYYQGKFKIKKIGKGETTSAKKSSLKTKFLKGQLLDEDGTSVLPSNFSGVMKYYGAETNIVSLVSLKKDIAESDGTNVTTLMNSHGIKGINVEVIKSKIIEKYGEHTPETQKEWFTENLTNLLSSVDTTVPETDSASLFTFDDLGNAEIPPKLAMYDLPGYYSKTTGELTQDVKEIASIFGDGTIVGQLPTSMNKNQKIQWLSAVKKGNFQKAYQIELDGAVHHGKSMPKGWMHPGYVDNSETHQIKWQSAVPGEIPAGSKIEGTWSSPEVHWSLAEVDNYLIKAQMQNPTYLTTQEKRNWVLYHMVGNTESVNNLSIVAKSRKDSGYSTQSEELQWTDDIVPAKTYDHLFESTDYPQNWGYEKQAALDWYNDNIENNPELEALAADSKKQMGYETYQWDDLDNYTKKATASIAVTSYFKQKEEDYQAELLKPVYTKEAGQTKGSHPGAFYTDQFGKKYYMKWWNNEDQLSNYRLEIEHAGNKIGRAFGFKTADSKLVQQDGHYGQMQDVVPGVGDMTGFDYSSITPQMVADIEGEHMLDWMLQNDDTKADNAIVTADGRIVGIDKARSFKDYGVVNWDHNAPDGNQSVYTRLYSAVKSGKISKETMDAAYLKARLTAARMQKMDNKKFFDLIEEGSKNRPSWTVSYKIDGKTVSQDLEGLKAAFADQKSKLSEKLDSEWAKLYKSAGLGDLPEPPKKPLGEGVISGFEDPELYENIAKTKVHGTSTLVSNGSVIGGTVLTWQDKTKDKDENNLNGEFYLAPKAQESLLTYLTANATDLSGNKTETTHFQGQDDKWEGILAMAKTVNQHATDGAYNETTVSNFEKIRTDIESDLAEWTPNLEANSTSPGGLDAYKFKSGKVVPLQYVDQYKLMLDYYQPKVEEIHTAHANKDKTGVYEKFTALEFDTTVKKHSNSDGESMTKMADGSWIFNDGKSVKIISDTMAQSALQDGGWVQDTSNSPEIPDTPVKIVKLGYTHEREGTVGAGGLKETNYSSGAAINGSSGQEFEITLPTGEKIYFRNAGHTSTKRGQQGRVTFHARGKGDVDSSPAAMQNVLDQLSNMGISLEASQPEDAELTYWREMYGILVNRDHSSSPKHEAVFKEMELKRKELGSTEANFLEDLSGSMSATEQTEFWRAIWAKHFGQNRVDVLISEEGYLPKFDHQNYQHSDIGTGKPYWERFDVDLEELFGQKTVLASTLGKSPKDLVKGGGALGAEERLRQLSDFHAGASWSAASDQGKGSSHNIYTRVKSLNSGDLSTYDAFYNMRVMLRTRTYSFQSDNYGALDNRKSGSPSNPVDVLKNFKNGGSNETMLPHMATFLDTIEFYVFNDAKEREEMIQYLKALGIEMIRGLPVEDRLVMRQNIKNAIEKVKETWKN